MPQAWRPTLMTDCSASLSSYLPVRFRRAGNRVTPNLRCFVDAQEPIRSGLRGASRRQEAIALDVVHLPAAGGSRPQPDGTAIRHCRSGACGSVLDASAAGSSTARVRAAREPSRRSDGGTNIRFSRRSETALVANVVSRRGAGGTLIGTGVAPAVRGPIGPGDCEAAPRSPMSVASVPGLSLGSHPAGVRFASSFCFGRCMTKRV